MADDILFGDYASDSEVDQGNIRRQTVNGIEMTLMDGKTNEEMDEDVLEEERVLSADLKISKRFEEALSILDICMESESQNWTSPITTLQGRPGKIDSCTNKKTKSLNIRP
jgi:hypothetical protein